MSPWASIYTDDLHGGIELLGLGLGLQRGGKTVAGGGWRAMEEFRGTLENKVVSGL